VAEESHSSLITHHSSLVLASSSPRRAEILKSLGIPFIVDPSSVDETPHDGETAPETASRLAEEKALEVAGRHDGRWVLGADTLVILDGAALGKPRDDEDARRMLGLLSGREHRVVTGVALACQGRTPRRFVEESRVAMATLTDEEIRWYVATGEPRDKAGAYAVQGLGSRFIEGVRGSYTNVMGLPARAVYRLMREAGDPALALLALSSS
jgi:nucleoside triphosphate pyrophosphatase